MKTWDALISAAIVGTQTPTGAIPVPGGELGEAWKKVGPGTPEEQLLSQAALISIYRGCGVIPDATEEVPPESTAKEDPRPTLPDSTIALLGEYLTEKGDVSDSLEEILEMIDRSGRVLPYAVLPQALALGRRNTQWRSGIIRVIGERGRWLAGKNPEWKYALGGEGQDPKVWDHGTIDQRESYLAELRATDPAKAREMLAAVWKQEKANQRARLLETMRIGIGQEDEEFLEKALDDRSAEVKSVAVDLIGLIPGSAYRERMKQRLIKGFLREDIEGKPDFRFKFQDVIDDAGIRDGIEELRRLQIQNNKKARILQNLIVKTSVSVWKDHYKLTPEEVIQATESSNEGEAVVHAMIEAHLYQGEFDWVVQALGNSAHWKHQPNINQMLSGLPMSKQQEIAQAVLGQKITGDAGILRARSVLGAQITVYTPEVTRLCLKQLEEWMDKKHNQANAIRKALIDALAKRGDVTFFAEVATLVRTALKEEEKTSWFDKRLASYELRHNLIKEILG